MPRRARLLGAALSLTLLAAACGADDGARVRDLGDSSDPRSESTSDSDAGDG